MNFFTIGFVLCGININIGLELGYVIRLVGLLFMLGGISETEAVDRSFGFARFRKTVFISIAAAAAGLLSALSVRLLNVGETAANIMSMIFGCASFVTVMLTQYSIITHMKPMRTLVNDLSLIRRFDSKWKKFAVFASVSLLCELVTRIAPAGGAVHTYSGLLLLITRILMIIMLCASAAAINAMRDDFNIMHRIDINE